MSKDKIDVEVALLSGHSARVSVDASATVLDLMQLAREALDIHISCLVAQWNPHFPFLLQGSLTLRLQIAQSRYDLQALDPNVGIICILGSLGL